jgi:signal recognition particle subunit SRP54
LPGAPGGLPQGMPGLPPNFPGMPGGLSGGLSGLGPKIPGLGGFPGLGKKK